MENKTDPILTITDFGLMGKTDMTQKQYVFTTCDMCYKGKEKQGYLLQNGQRKAGGKQAPGLYWTLWPVK